MSSENPATNEGSVVVKPIEDPQKQKLLLEIKQLERPWFKQVLYAPTFLPTIIAIITLTIAIWTGLFDVKRERLQLEIVKFESEKDKIFKEYQSLKLERDSLIKTNLALINQKDSLTNFTGEAIARLKNIDQLANKIPVNYILVGEDGQQLMTEDGKLIVSEDHPIIKKLRLESKALQKLFDKSFDKTFE